MPVYNPPPKRPRLGLGSGPVTAANPQNAGLAAGVNGLAAQNAAVAQRNSLGGATYAQRLQNGSQSFASPEAGARYGAATDRLAAARAPLGLAPAAEGDIQRQVGINQQGNGREALLADMNGRGRAVHADNRFGPNGSSYSTAMDGSPVAHGPTAGTLFGGAIPGNVAYGSAGLGIGSQFAGSAGARPGFLAPAAQDAAGLKDKAQLEDFARRNGYSFNKETGQMGNTSVLSMSPTEAKVAGITGRGPGQYMKPAATNEPSAYMVSSGGAPTSSLGLGQRQADYRERTTANMADRRGLAQANAFNKSQARKSRLGIGDPLDMAQRQNPAVAGALGLAGIQGQTAVNVARETAKGRSAEFAAKNDSARQRDAAAVYAQLRGANVSHEDAVRQSGFQAPGLGLAATGPTKKPSEAPAASSLRGQPPDVIEEQLKGLPPETQARLRREAQNPSLGSAFANSPLGHYFGGGLGDMIGRNTNPYGPWAGLFGINPPPLARPARRGVPLTK